MSLTVAMSEEDIIDQRLTCVFHQSLTWAEIAFSVQNIIISEDGWCGFRFIDTAIFIVTTRLGIVVL